MKKIIVSENSPKAIGPYSQAVEANGILFVSGQIPLNPETSELVDGIQQQTVQVLKNIGGILKEAGYDYNHVVKTTCLLSDMANFTEMNKVYSQYFKKNPPARAAFAVKGLPLGALVEIEAIAIKS